MASSPTVKLPPGFVLEQTPQQSAPVNLRAGFVLEQPQSQPEQRWSDPRPETDLASRVGNFVRGGVATLTAPLLHPIETLQSMGQSQIAAGRTPYGAPIVAPTGNQQRDAANQQVVQGTQKEVVNSAGRELKEHPAYMAGSVLVPAAVGALAPKVLPRVARLAPKVAKAAVEVPMAAAEKVTAPLTNKPQLTMPEAAGLPKAAINGAEDIFRASAPTGMNKGFRANVYAAAGDLADIGRKLDLQESKGGIINPDMRVRSTVSAIREHLDAMYNQERVPQIQRHADVPVNVGMNENAMRGLEYLASTAGDVADARLAQSALDHGVLTVAEADRLAIIANQTLKSYERMTPEGKMQAQMTNPKIGGLKALDADLSKSLNDVLKKRGEPGLQSYERRFAALSSIRDALEARQNAVELNQPGMLKAVVRPVVATLTNGKSGIASASQAAVSDVNIGRMLERGFKKLSQSELSATKASAPLPSKKLIAAPLPRKSN